MFLYCVHVGTYRSFRNLLRSAGDTSAERVPVTTHTPLEERDTARMRKALAEIEVLDVFKVTSGMGYIFAWFVMYIARDPICTLLSVSR